MSESLSHVDRIIEDSWNAAGRELQGHYVAVTRHRNGAAEAYAFPLSKRRAFYRNSGVPTGDYLFPWEVKKLEEGVRPRYRRLKSEGARRNSVDVERAARRASKQVRTRIMALGCDHLLTLTYRENMQDYERAKADWDRFVRLVRMKKKRWAYVVVPEFQERGAIHFHAAVRGFQDVRYLRKCWYAVVGENGGNVDVQSRKKRWGSEEEEWSLNKLASYLTKYLKKDMEKREAWAKRYWSTKLDDTTRPTKEVYWIQAFDGVHLIQEVYEIVAGSRAVGVVQHLLPGEETRYWLSVPPLPKPLVV